MKKRVQIKETPVKIIVAFGDIGDFGAWTRRTNASPEEFRNLMAGYLSICEDFLERNPSAFMKQLGDGFIVVFEMGQAHNCALALRVLKEIQVLIRAMNRVIKECSYPRPHGFRARIVAGPAYKTRMLIKGYDRDRIDFLGYSVNLCARLLDIQRERPMVIHESVKELMGKKQLGQITLKKISADGVPRGIDEDDLKGLWELLPKKKRRQHGSTR